MQILYPANMIFPNTVIPTAILPTFSFKAMKSDDQPH